MNEMLEAMATNANTPSNLLPDKPPMEDFSAWEDPDIKAFLKDVTGETPKGNPKHETLVKLAEEAVAAREAA